MSQPFEPTQPARNLTKMICGWALYEQHGQTWLYEHHSQEAYRVEDTLPWLNEAEQIAHARKAVGR